MKTISLTDEQLNLLNHYGEVELDDVTIQLSRNEMNTTASAGGSYSTPYAFSKTKGGGGRIHKDYEEVKNKYLTEMYKKIIGITTVKNIIQEEEDFQKTIYWNMPTMGKVLFKDEMSDNIKKASINSNGMFKYDGKMINTSDLTENDPEELQMALEREFPNTTFIFDQNLR